MNQEPGVEPEKGVVSETDTSLRRISRKDGAAYHAQQLLQFLEQEKETLSPLLILSHDYPDPDALASAYALQYLAKQVFGIDSKIGYSGTIGRAENREMVKILKIPVHRITPQVVRRYKKVALVDTQPRFENNSFPAKRRATIIVDQHPSETEPAADLVVVDPECGATCVILAQALLMKAVELPDKLATAIAYGIISDTLDLYRVKRPDVIQTYLSVLHRCDMKLLAQIQNPSRSRPFFSALGKGIIRATAYRRLMVSHLGEVKSPEQVSLVADFLLTYERVNWSFCTGRYKGNLHFSLRSKIAQAQAGEVLRDVVEDRNDAGGHGTMAGGRLFVGKNVAEEKWEERERALQTRLAKRLRIRAAGEFRKIF